MLGQRLADPHILALVGCDQQNEVVAGGVVRVQEVRD
jgi:hypothetical protein